MARRRGKQSGHLKIEGPSWIGYWWEEVRLPTGELKWHRFSKKVCDAVQLDPVTTKLRKVTEKEAKRLFDEIILSKLEVANTNPQSLATLNEFVRLKFEPSLSLKKRKSQEHYRGMLKNHILPTLGETRLRDIRLENVQELIYQKAGSGLSSQTVTHIRNVLSTTFRKAKDFGWRSGDSPTIGVELPELVHRKRTALTDDQVRMVLDNCDLTMYCIVLADSILGLRRGELAGLRWKRLNLTDQPTIVEGEVIQPYTVAIREQYVWVYGKHLAKEQRGGRYETLKTDNGRRNIPITPVLCSVFDDLRNRSAHSGPDDPVFSGRTGKPLDFHNYLADHFKPLLRSLGLPEISWHDLRHTNATLAEIAGATTTNRNKVLGHGGDRMAQHYTHEDMRQARGALDRVEAAVLPKARLKLVK